MKVPSFTRQDFAFIAATLKDSKPTYMEVWQKHEAWKELVSVFAERLSQTNPSFKKDRFLEACGIDE